LRGIADPTEGILAGIQGEAFMCGKGSGNLAQRQDTIFNPGVELRTAASTDSGEVRSGFHDAESTLCHQPSLAPLNAPVDIKWHHC
jgi:hypothetical protein